MVGGIGEEDVVQADFRTSAVLDLAAQRAG